MTNAEAIAELRNMQKFNYTLAPDEVFQMAISALEKQDGDWNNHKVACLLAEMFGDNCSCNFNGIDEWLPMKCDFAETACPNPAGVACWEQFLKHRSDEHGAD